MFALLRRLLGDKCKKRSINVGETTRSFQSHNLVLASASTVSDALNLLPDHFRATSKIGYGTYSSVWKVLNTNTGVTVAVKAMSFVSENNGEDGEE